VLVSSHHLSLRCGVTCACLPPYPGKLLIEWDGDEIGVDLSWVEETRLFT